MSSNNTFKKSLNFLAAIVLLILFVVIMVAFSTNNNEQNIAQNVAIWQEEYV